MESKVPSEVEQIKAAAGEYRKWALEARKKYIKLRLLQDPEIRKLYEQAPIQPCQCQGTDAPPHPEGGS